MDDIKIKKISTDMTNYVDIDGNFNIALKKIDFELSAKDYNILFPTDPRITVSNIDFYIVDENGKEYSCIGCVAGLYFGQSIKIKVISINLIFEDLIHNSEDLKTNYIKFETSCSSSILVSSFAFSSPLVDNIIFLLYSLQRTL